MLMKMIEMLADGLTVITKIAVQRHAVIEIVHDLDLSTYVVRHPKNGVRTFGEVQRGQVIVLPTECRLLVYENASTWLIRNPLNPTQRERSGAWETC